MPDEPRGSDQIDNIDLDPSGPAGKPSDKQGSNDSSGEDEGDEGSSSKETPTRNDMTHKVTVQVDKSVVEKMRAAVYYTPGLTMWQIVQKGAKAVVGELEKQRGEEFPEFDGQLEGGRPPKGTAGLDL